jgi:hypothetical protein
MWRTYSALDAADRPLVAEAATLLAIAWVGLRVAPFRVLRRLLDWHARTAPAATPASFDVVARISWAVAAVSRRFPERTMTCLTQALAGAAMLKRRGHAAELRFGVRGVTPFEAHAWVECEGRVVIGDRHDLAQYSVLAVPPGSPHLTPGPCVAPSARAPTDARS